MKKQQVEDTIRRSFTALPHDDLPQAVYDACNAQSMPESTPPAKRPVVRLLPRVAAIAAALSVTVLGGALILHGALSHAPMSVSLDVNPSIHIEVDDAERVKEVSALNEDGALIIGDKDFAGDSVKDTVNVLVEAMVEHGYLSEVANSVLISVDSDNVAKASLLQTKLTDEVETMLAGGGFEGAVMSQTMHSDEELARLAQDYQISTGKAMLICRILELDPIKTFDDLAGLSINELNLLVEQLQSPAIYAKGHASDKAYIGADAALQAAVDHAGFTAADVVVKESELDHENGIMCYEIEFVVDGVEYDYDIDALSGEVLKNKQETEDEDDDEKEKQALLAGVEHYADVATVKETVLTHAGVTETDVTAYDIELDVKKGVVVYEVDFECGTTEYEYIVDATTGEILRHETEIDDENEDEDDNDNDNDDNEGETLPVGDCLDTAQVKAIVLAHAGLTEADITAFECEPESRHGTAVYEVEWQAGTTEYEYTVDATTGDILDSREEVDD